MAKVSLAERLVVTALAFRGYNTTNLGRTPELLEHPRYGATVREALTEASTIVADTLSVPCDLVERVIARRESTLATFAEDIALILSVEGAQLRLLGEQFGIDTRRAATSLGYSLGEIGALIHAGVYQLRDVLVPLVTLAGDCAALADGASMGIVFSRGPALALDVVERLCQEITVQGLGAIAISSILSPNTALVLGQGGTLDKLKLALKAALPAGVQVRKNDERWPPLHTPILWQRAVVDRAGVMMQTMPHGTTAPQMPVLSLVTGKASYTPTNSRRMLRDWLDHPQRLWDVVYELLAQGIEVVWHVGPNPNLIPATFKRLSENVTAQINASRWSRLGLETMQGLAGRPWLRRLLSSRVALLRAPLVEHVVIEDWLLAQTQSSS